MSVRIIQGDVREELPKLPADYFDCIVTSPPYYGLRDYGTATWEGGDQECDHRNHIPQGVNSSSTLRLDGKPHHHLANDQVSGLPYRDICGKCGARRIDAQIGLEPTLDAYLETMVAVCRELRRVLKPSGVFFLNIGDSYAGGNGLGRNDADNHSANFSPGGGNKHGSGNVGRQGIFQKITGLKPKDLCLVPERLGIALQHDGWWVRSHIIWAKPNPMPESVTDRPTSAHETIWMLTKGARYFWDAEAVREPINPNNNGECSVVERSGGTSFDDNRKPIGALRRYETIKGANLRNVWMIASHPFPGAHFATFPPALVERCIKAGSPRYGHVLDPFAGSGTTGLVADRLGRDATLIDLNTSYIDMAVNRIRDDAPLFAEVAAE